MARAEVTTIVTEIARPLLESMGIELVEIEYKREGQGMVLRLFIDKPGGIMLDDCTNVSKELSELLDVEEAISAANYNLEVSSPGINRPLTKPADYHRFAGRLIKVRTYEMQEDSAGNKRKTFTGTLQELAGDVVVIKLKEGQNASIPLDRIAKANLEFEF